MKCATPNCDQQAIRVFCKRCGANRRNAARKIKYLWTPAMDDAIREAYRRHVTTGRKVSIKETLGRRFGRPAFSIQKRASKLGLCRAKEKPWTEQELEILEANSWKSEDRISAILRTRGFRRSPNAVHVKRVRFLGERRQNYPFYSAHALAKLMGIDSHQVTRWIALGLLMAERRGTRRNERQGGDEWAMSPAAVRQFMIENPLGFDLRKVEQLWFMDLLTNKKANRYGSLRIEGGHPRHSQGIAPMPEGTAA